MEFTTRIPIATSGHPIDYSSRIWGIGSCFVENMGGKFDYFKFRNSLNPFGIVFNPVSIEKLVVKMVNGVKFSESDLFFHNERWHCYDVHSDWSSPDPSAMPEQLNRKMEESQRLLADASHIIITYGTSWVYRLKTSGEVVANCHKVPQNQFEKELLSVEGIADSIQNTMDAIRKINPGCHLIFTISPVRHLKDGFVENQISKSHLISGLHTSIIHHPGTSYFPAYEIMMDELRDYRFYANDMLHPSQMAIDYIWERFSLSHVDESAYRFMEEVGSVQKSLQHKPFHPGSESHRKFRDSLKQKTDALQERFPFMRF